MRIRLEFMLCLALVASSATHCGAVPPYDIVDAAKRGDMHAVRKHLEGNPELAQSCDAMNYTALDWACTRGHWRIVDNLIAAGAPLDHVGGDGGTCMHKACHHEAPEMIRKLIDAGADISVANQWGRVPLHVVARRGCIETARVLIEAGADLEAATREGWTPLHVAYKAGQPEMVKFLLARGADKNCKDSDGKKPHGMKMTRPEAIELDPAALDEFSGHFDLGGGFSFKFWREGDALRIQEFAPDDLYPIGKDEFFCVREPWRVKFIRDDAEAIVAVDVDFLRRTVRGTKREHPYYVGSDACMDCHLDGDDMNHYLTWVRTNHAGAYWRLATDWSKLLAKFRPAYSDITEPITEDRCLLCHLTAAQDPDALLASSYRIEEGIGCETCHGPGSLYLDAEVMEDREAFLAAGGIIPDETTCQRCHRNRDRFDYETWLPKIDHRKRSDGSH
ncbi:MAG: hypothetical protein GY835_14160 [bacterium]|nr:hypothetical protein [bacterium]